MIIIIRCIGIGNKKNPFYICFIAGKEENLSIVLSMKDILIIEISISTKRITIHCLSIFKSFFFPHSITKELHHHINRGIGSIFLPHSVVEISIKAFVFSMERLL